MANRPDDVAAIDPKWYGSHLVWEDAGRKNNGNGKNRCKNENPVAAELLLNRCGGAWGLSSILVLKAWPWRRLSMTCPKGGMADFCRTHQPF